MAKKRKARVPYIGEIFNPEHMDIGEAFDRLADVLEEYRPRGFGALRNDLRRGANAYAADNQTDETADVIQVAHDAATEAENLLSDMAQSRTRNPYIYFAWDGDFCGFRINVDSAIEDADWIQYDSPRGRWDDVPRGASGLLIQVSDHGNVSAYRVARGREYEIFAVV